MINFTSNTEQKYEVFFNEYRLTLISDTNYSLKCNTPQIVGINGIDEFIRLLSDMEKHSISFKELICVVKSGFVRQFVEYFTVIRAAGGVVADSSDRVLVIKRFGKWDFPKGKIEKGETAKEAAIREIQEECGLTGLKIVSLLKTTSHIYRSPYLKVPHNWVLKKTKWFEVVHIGNCETKPQTEEGIEAAEWFERGKLYLVLGNTFENLKDIIKHKGTKTQG